VYELANYTFFFQPFNVRKAIHASTVLSAGEVFLRNHLGASTTLLRTDERVFS